MMTLAVLKKVFSKILYTQCWINYESLCTTVKTEIAYYLGYIGMER